MKISLAAAPEYRVEKFLHNDDLSVLSSRDIRPAPSRPVRSGPFPSRLARPPPDPVNLNGSSREKDMRSKTARESEEGSGRNRTTFAKRAWAVSGSRLPTFAEKPSWVSRRKLALEQHRAQAMRVFVENPYRKSISQKVKVEVPSGLTRPPKINAAATTSSNAGRANGTKGVIPHRQHEPSQEKSATLEDLPAVAEVTEVHALLPETATATSSSGSSADSTAAVAVAPALNSPICSSNSVSPRHRETMASSGSSIIGEGRRESTTCTTITTTVAAPSAVAEQIPCASGVGVSVYSDGDQTPVKGVTRRTCLSRAPPQQQHGSPPYQAVEGSADGGSDGGATGGKSNVSPPESPPSPYREQSNAFVFHSCPGRTTQGDWMTSTHGLGEDLPGLGRPHAAGEIARPVGSLAAGAAVTVQDRDGLCSFLDQRIVVPTKFAAAVAAQEQEQEQEQDEHPSNLERLSPTAAAFAQPMLPLHEQLDRSLKPQNMKRSDSAPMSLPPSDGEDACPVSDVVDSGAPANHDPAPRYDEIFGGGNGRRHKEGNGDIFSSAGGLRHKDRSNTADFTGRAKSGRRRPRPHRSKSLHIQRSLWSDSDGSNSEGGNDDDMFDTSFDDFDQEVNRTRSGPVFGGKGEGLPTKPRAAMSPVTWHRRGGTNAEFEDSRASGCDSAFGSTAPTTAATAEILQQSPVNTAAAKRTASLQSAASRAENVVSGEASSGTVASRTELWLSLGAPAPAPSVGEAAAATLVAAEEREGSTSAVTSLMGKVSSLVEKVNTKSSERVVVGGADAAAAAATPQQSLAHRTGGPSGSRVNSFVQIFNTASGANRVAVDGSNSNSSSGSSNKNGTGRSSSGTYLPRRYPLAAATASDVAPPSGDFVPKGKARAVAASFTWRVVGGDGRRGTFSGFEGRGRAAGAKKGAAATTAAPPAGESKRVSAIEGLTFGSVRAKAIAWGKSRNR